MFRKILGFTSYTEGWALYAERLAWEYGFYENDPNGGGNWSESAVNAAEFGLEIGT